MHLSHIKCVVAYWPAKGSRKLEVSIVFAVKVMLMNSTKVYYYFFKAPSGNYKDSDTYQQNQLVTEQGAYSKSM